MSKPADKPEQAAPQVAAAPVKETAAATPKRTAPVFPSLFSLTTRDLFSISPVELMKRFTEDLEGYFSEFGFTREFDFGERALWRPIIEVFERAGAFVVRAELPGLSKDDVKVELEENRLIIKGERKSETEKREKEFYRSERSYGSFYRAISLPEGANLEQLQAQLNNGVLEITVPIPETVSKRRNIPIQVKTVEQK